MTKLFEILTFSSIVQTFSIISNMCKFLFTNNLIPCNMIYTKFPKTMAKIFKTNFL